LIKYNTPAIRAYNCGEAFTVRFVIQSFSKTRLAGMAFRRQCDAQSHYLSNLDAR
jgi:hypothetical protein